MANSALLTLPDLGEGLTEARVLSLLTPAGGKIEVDAPVVVVETDKSVVELPAPLSGYVAEWFVRESDVIRVGEPLARFDAEPVGTPPLRMPTFQTAPAAPPPAPPAPAQATAAPPPAQATTAPRRGDERARISPAARRRARDLGIELDAVVANGAAGGTISADTVQRFSEQPRPAAPSVLSGASSAAPAAAGSTAAAAPAAVGGGTLVVLSRRLDLALLRDGTAWLGLAETVAKALFRAAQRVTGLAPHAALPAGLRVRRFGEAAERRWLVPDVANGGLTEASVPREPGAGPVWEVVYAPGDALAAFSAGPARALQLTFCSGASPSVSLLSTDPAWGEEAVLLLWDELAAALHAVAFSPATGRIS